MENEMNERIAGLMRSKGLHKYITEDCQHRMEMLAELIVEECAYAIQDFVNHRRPASEYPELLKHHFGVK
jgi:hypothetical protein